MLTFGSSNRTKCGTLRRDTPNISAVSFAVANISTNNYSIPLTFILTAIMVSQQTDLRVA